jgi:alpha-1,3-rhamnosyl/mannosyltransferase
LVDRTARNSRFDLDVLAQTSAISVRNVHAPVFSPFGAARVSRLLHTLSSDVYHAPHYLYPFVSHGHAVVTLFDLIPLATEAAATTCSLPRRILFRLSIRSAMDRAERVIVPSKATEVDVVRFHVDRRDRVTRIPIGVDPWFGPVTPESIDNVRRRFDLPRRFVLCVGINKPHKNHVALVRALHMSTFPSDVSLVIAGPVDRRFPTAADFAREDCLESRVRVLGEVPTGDLSALYAAADVFAFPSLAEGFGLPPLEAMRCGTPVACARAGALTEVVGDAARLFNPLEPRDIASTLGALLNDPAERARLSDAGIAQAARYEWDTTAQVTWQIYRDVAGA